MMLPEDYRQFIKHYGTGVVAGFLRVYNPITRFDSLNLVKLARGHEDDPYNALREEFPRNYPYPRYPEAGGLLPWGNTINGDVLYWWTNRERDLWSVVLYPRHEEHFYTFPAGMVSFISDLIMTGLGQNIFPGEAFQEGQYIVPRL